MKTSDIESCWTDPATGERFNLSQVPFAFSDRQYQEESHGIYERYACRHASEKSEIVWKAVGNGKAQLRNQCLRCGALWGTALRRELAHQGTPDANTERADQWERRRETEIRQAKIRAIQRHNEWWRWYDSYLGTEQWRGKRDLVLKRAGGLCEGCGQRPAQQVHHLTYKNVGEEFLFQLVAVCMACHERLHEKEMEVAA